MTTQMNVGIVYPTRANQPADVDHPAVREWLFAREMFRRLGFAPQDLYLGLHRVTGGAKYEPPREDACAITCILKTQGRDLEWIIGVVSEPEDAVAKRYEEWVVVWNRGDRWDIETFRASWVMQKSVDLLEHLAFAEIAIPKHPT